MYYLNLHNSSAFVILTKLELQSKARSEQKRSFSCSYLTTFRFNQQCFFVY